MLTILLLYLLTDGWLHKGMVRVLWTKSFSFVPECNISPDKENAATISDKHWVKAVNTSSEIDALDKTVDGFECDVYYNREKNSLEVHHDENLGTGYRLDSLLATYQRRGLTASIWIDLKNLDSSIQKPALDLFVSLRERYGLQRKVLIESQRPAFLNLFSDSGFYTVFYAPFFNPYKLEPDSLKKISESLCQQLSDSKVNAVSGYYFQYPYLKQVFKNHKVLTWAQNDRWSLVNFIFLKKLAADSAIGIVLYPE